MDLQWNESLAVGHPLIDAQHQGLFEQFNAFLEACNARRGAAHLREVFSYLDAYVERHFLEEEALMERHAFSEAPQHQAEHRIFRGRIEELKKELERSGPTVQVLIRTNKALLYWLTEHIRNVDTRLALFIARQV